MNLVKLVLAVAISFIGLGATASFFKGIDEVYLEEPTHLMTEEEMIQVCIEEGIPLE